MLPDNFAVLVVGDPSAGMFEFCSYLASCYLDADERLVFVETNTTADHVRHQLQMFGVDPTYHEDRDRLRVIDCYTPRGKAGDDHLMVELFDVTNLEGMLERVEEGIVAVGGQPVKILFDSLTPLYMYHDSNDVGKFFSALTSMVKMSGKITATVHRGIVPDEQIALLSTISDGVLEMRMDESFHRHVRIRHFRGLRVTPRWVPFDFDRESETGVTVLGWTRD